MLQKKPLVKIKFLEIAKAPLKIINCTSVSQNNHIPLQPWLITICIINYKVCTKYFRRKRYVYLTFFIIRLNTLSFLLQKVRKYSTWILRVAEYRSNFLTHLFPCTLSLSPGNIRKPYSFLKFSGCRERLHWERIGQG